MKRVFVTGVSSGIGEALAWKYLSLGYEVYGVSRRTPHSLLNEAHFHFKNFDLTHYHKTIDIFTEQFAVLLTQGAELVFLNAGISGDVPKLGVDFNCDELEQVYAVNVMANKALMDCFLGAQHKPAQFVFSASMAGVRFREGTLSYSMSKAALKALAGVYAQEHPDVFFAVMGMCNVNSSLSRQVSFSERTKDFPALHALQQRALSDGYMVSPSQRADDVYAIINTVAGYGLKTGVFADIRDLLKLKTEVANVS